ncbi:DsbA family protein [Streptomyces jumonjinensis]|uniref:DsbA family protein n=1 Tax=Streptomyces jumonjinensis TaxID=1945 RepID=UPI0037B7FC49
MSDESRTVNRSPVVIAVVAIIVLALGFASFVADMTGPAQRSQEVESWPGDDVMWEAYGRLEEGDPLAVGRVDAPVVMIEYADFRCGYCGKFARDIEPELIRRYVDTGVLRIEWRNFPVLGAESEDAARAGWAAGQQGRFWEFHSLAYARGAEFEGFSESRLKKLAKKAGVSDPDRFATDMHSRVADGWIGNDQGEAEKLGVVSTPTFLINGRPIVGAQSLDVFVEAIEDAHDRPWGSAGPSRGADSPSPPGH